ncbi:CYTH domain-containing protein [Urechidicola croceus]|uniref:Adenylate cyclase n=1 Tax=Urechidicola croceus TaxID=1850246 RepID=A0A1D8P997_9FLAO|nr:CYTH domain-containing protein [Urechidicola croceus]AOW21137.1 adenylate cyclase [Urechidicola croceus]
MAVEIERKFLLKNDSFKSESFKTSYIKQGFLNSNKNRVVRVRLIDKSGYLTVKGISNEEGLTRFEWEKKISKKDAESLLKLCEKGVIEKYRHFIKKGKHTFEVDEFLGDNIGLVIAEIELSEENEDFDKPKWLGKEVTGIIKYYNSELSKNSFKNWT